MGKLLIKLFQMKKIFLLLAIFALVSCGNDDNNTPVIPNLSTGTLTINGTNHSLLHGYIYLPISENPEYDPRRFNIILSDGNISSSGSFASNVHTLVDLGLYTSAAHPGSVESTTYDLYFPMTSDFDDPFIDNGSVATSVVTSNGTYVSGNEFDSDDMDSGHASITNTNGVYTITFDFTNAGSTISGTFTGTLTPLTVN